MDTERNTPLYMIVGVLLAILVIGGIVLFTYQRPADAPSTTTINKTTTVNPSPSSPNINVSPPNVNVAPPKVDVNVTPPPAGDSNKSQGGDTKGGGGTGGGTESGGGTDKGGSDK